MALVKAVWVSGRRGHARGEPRRRRIAVRSSGSATKRSILEWPGSIDHRPYGDPIFERSCASCQPGSHQQQGNRDEDEYEHEELPNVLLVEFAIPTARVSPRWEGSYGPSNAPSVRWATGIASSRRPSNEAVKPGAGRLFLPIGGKIVERIANDGPTVCAGRQTTPSIPFRLCPGHPRINAILCIVKTHESCVIAALDGVSDPLRSA